MYRVKLCLVPNFAVSQFQLETMHNPKVYHVFIVVEYSREKQWNQEVKLYSFNIYNFCQLYLRAKKKKKEIRLSESLLSYFPYYDRNNKVFKKEKIKK